ncbi:MAG: DEAD/DEAH box helicase [Desulfuromonadaceae bacterium]|nr:DEAD/DEAH box helicase [Desulfuromonadaceae bacterium]
MQIHYSNKIHIKNPTQKIIDYARNVLTITNPEFVKKLEQNKWLGNTPPRIFLYEKIGNDYLFPYGTRNYLEHIIKTSIIIPEITEDLSDSHNVNHISKIKLYDNQEEAVTNVLKHNNGILVSPCGSGKTQMGLELIARLGKRTLWITHTTDLLNQSKKRYIDNFNVYNGDVGTITNGKVDIGNKITFATIQTLYQLALHNYADIWDVIVIDECQHVGGNATNVTMYYNVLTSLKARYRYGITATAKRTDGTTQAMLALIGDIVYEVVDDVKKVPIEVRIINTEFKPIIQNITKSDFTIDYHKVLDEVTTNKKRNEKLLKLIHKVKETDSVIVLSSRLAHLEFLHNNTKNSAFIKGIKSKSREETLENFKNGKIKVLFATYKLLKEGFDYPELSSLILATPEKDEVTIIQSCGRVSRYTPNKKQGYVYDLCDDFGMYKSWAKLRRRYYNKLDYIINEEFRYE